MTVPSTSPIAAAPTTFPETPEVALDPNAPLDVGFTEIEAARERIRGAVFESPFAYTEALSKRAGAKIWLKLENLQMTGAYKERGAANKLLSLGPDERARGVVAASAGNHAQGVAYHAQRLGIDATIVMPEGTPLIKVSSTRGFGARVILHGANYDEARDLALELEKAEGRVFVHAFDDPLIIAGQGTIALEILEQNPYLDAIVVPIGGGGLIGGIACAIKEVNPKIKVYGVEARSIAAMRAALDHRHPVTLPPGRTIADGIAVRTVARRTHRLVERYVDDVVTVDEEEIAEAILLLLEREKTVAEGAGATPLAAVLSGRLPVKGKKLGLVVSGGNIDVNLVSRIIERGLIKSGRMMRVVLILPDVTGALAGLTRLIADHKGNVMQILHDRASLRGGLGEAIVELTLETRGFDHIAEIERALDASGYRVVHETATVGGPAGSTR
jgi:threonine dehydratase